MPSLMRLPNGKRHTRRREPPFFNSPSTIAPGEYFDTLGSVGTFLSEIGPKNWTIIFTKPIDKTAIPCYNKEKKRGTQK